MSRTSPPRLPPGQTASTEELLGHLRYRLQPPARSSNRAARLPEPVRDTTLQPGGWLEPVLRQYGPGMPFPPLRKRRSRAHLWLLAVTVLIVAGGGFYWRELRAAYADAYPGEPDKREALRACSLENPTFIRFLPDERSACYERIAARLSGTSAASSEDRSSGP
ncbi:MAG: hypothetical protein JO305_10305 [Alphaproteobacteria bacterium]|nr:hypothetical protein [Alphaproteobacteria bacterium]